METNTTNTDEPAEERRVKVRMTQTVRTAGGHYNVGAVLFLPLSEACGWFLLEWASPEEWTPTEDDLRAGTLVALKEIDGERRRRGTNEAHFLAIPSFGRRVKRIEALLGVGAGGVA